MSFSREDVYILYMKETEQLLCMEGWGAVPVSFCSNDAFIGEIF